MAIKALRLIVCLAALTSTAPATALAAEPLGAKGRLAAATRIVSMDFRAFAAFKRSHPRAYDIYDWSSDGCNWPAQSPRLFRVACELHDFGYRNFGGHGLALARNDAARRWIDDRQEVEMTRICDLVFDGWWEVDRRLACRSDANLNWSGVRLRGAGSFYD